MMKQLRRPTLALSLALLAGGCAQDPSLTVLSRDEVLLDRAVREPAIVQHPTGVLFVAGYSRDPAEAADPPNLYRSDDGGAAWAPVDVGTVEDGALGNSDVDLEIAPDGSIYFLTMGFDRSVGEGTHVAVGISRDVGRTWTWRTISRTRFDDRPWIGVSAESGRLHVVWNDGSGVRHAISDDRGESWEEGPRISTGGGSSHLAMGPEGRIAVRITPGSASGQKLEPEVDLIAVSDDDGRTWQEHSVPGERDWTALPRWVEPIAWSESGELFYLWSGGRELHLGRSEDSGASWTSAAIIQGDEELYFPFLTLGPNGLLGATWFSGFDDDLRAHVALLDTRARTVRVRQTMPLTVDAWRAGDGGRTRDPAGEYFPLAFLDDGDLAAVLPIQDAEGRDGFSWVRIER